MLTAQPSQLRLADDGSVLYQPQPTNPLPGDAIAKIRKGRLPLSPEIDLLETSVAAGQDKSAAKEFLAAWLKTHIASVLETLKGLEDTDALAGPVRGICFQLSEAMGIVPRENLEDLIKDLDSDMRQSLRAKQVRLGPVLVFLPALNKPAAVRLRGLLWSLWNEKPLPAANMPADGVVSFRIDPKAADRKFYQAIGYPVYGLRAIRIDMLDRVISAVYDNAKDGKFRAEHKMAEWLGCPIDDLYEILGAMGHRKIDESKKPEEESAAAPDVKPADAKPELAQFFLKKGKAFEQQKPRIHPKSGGKTKDRPQDRKTQKSAEPRTMSAGIQSRPEDSPFAVLQQLKVKKDAAGS